MRNTAFALAVGFAALTAQETVAQATSTAAGRTSPSDTTKTAPLPGSISTPNADPYPSTYAPFRSRTTLIRNASILTAASPTIRNGSILMRDGKIVEVG